MVLNDLRPVLSADNVNLYVEVGKPIKYECLYDYDYSNYDRRDVKKERNYKKDTMFRDYGNYIVLSIYNNRDELNTVNIDLDPPYYENW